VNSYLALIEAQARSRKAERKEQDARARAAILDVQAQRKDAELRAKGKDVEADLRKTVAQNQKELLPNVGADSATRDAMRDEALKRLNDVVNNAKSDWYKQRDELTAKGGSDKE